MKTLIGAFMIVALSSIAALADMKELDEAISREVELLNRQKVLAEHSPDEYAKALATAARTGVTPAWAIEYGKQMERRQKTDPMSIDDMIRTNPKTARTGIFDDGYKIAITDAAKQSAAQLSAGFMDQEQMLRIAGIALLILILLALYFWMPWRRLFELTAPVEGSPISRFEIVLLWIAGVWAVLVFAESDILRGLEFRQSYRGVFAGWIPLALIAITRRFWR